MNMDKPATTIEFAVEKLDATNDAALKKSLDSFGEVNIDKENGRLVIKSVYPWVEIKEKIESTGRRAILTGCGNQSAVVTINSDKIRGVVRFTAIDGSAKGCTIDGALDGAESKQYILNIHEYGDFSQDCDNVGDILKIQDIYVGKLGTIASDANGRGAFKFKNNSLTVTDIIGRSFVVNEIAPDNSSTIISWGMIARSAGILQNYKKFCACDGVSLWDEQQNKKPNKL